VKRPWPKRTAAFALCGLAAFFAAAPARANSGPAHWQSAPSLSITPLKDCPVTVAGEDLLFDFTQKTKGSFSPEAKVTAAYRMKNPTAEPLTVQMAFPLIASLNDLAAAGGVEISSDGVKLPFEICPGDIKPCTGLTHHYYTESGELVKNPLPSFSQILKSVSQKTAGQNRFKGTGTLYRISYPGNAFLSASVQSKGTDAILPGDSLNGISEGDGKITLESSVGSGLSDEFSFLIFGAGTPEVKAYTDSSRKTVSPKPPSVETSRQSADAFFAAQLEKSRIYQAFPSKAFLSRLVSAEKEEAEEALDKGESVYSAHGMSPVFDGDNCAYDFYEQPRILVLAYEVAFPAGGTRDVSVSYPMSGSMESEKTAEPIYTYGYLLNPAKGWADFQNLNIRIFPPEKDPYLVKSSLPFTRSAKGAYTAKFSALPETDLVFSLYQNRQVEAKSGNLPQKIVTVLAVSAVLLAALLLYGRIRKTK